MGLLISKIHDLFSSFRKDQRVLMLGLDAAGKTTILYKLKLGDTIHTIPTIGFNVETVDYKKLSFTIFDVGGQEKIRPLWKHYLIGTDALLFVVDSADRERIEEAQEELAYLLQQDELRDACVLVYANKQDLPGAMSCQEVAEKLGLHHQRHRKWHVQSTMAVHGDGLYEGLDWTAEALKQTQKQQRRSM